MKKLLTIVIGIMPTYFAITIGNEIPAGGFIGITTLVALMITISHDESDFEAGFMKTWWLIHLIGIMAVVFYYSRFFAG